MTKEKGGYSFKALLPSALRHPTSVSLLVLKDHLRLPPNSSNMKNNFTLGIEEELQILDPETLGLSPHASLILPEANLLHGDSVKPEGHSCMIEICTGVCSDVYRVGQRLLELRKSISQIAAKRNLKLSSAGTHPFSSWKDQFITDNLFFKGMEKEFQDVARSSLTFGLHVHTGITHRETALQALNGLRTHLPLLLALSVNSPFYEGRDTGCKSFRSIIYNRLPRSGIPDYFENLQAYEEYLDTLRKTGCLPYPGKLWWDARIHPFYETLEVRICDAQTEIEDSVRLAVIIQALVKTLCDDYTNGAKFDPIPTSLIGENRWRAGRYGLECNLVDFANLKEIPCREAAGLLMEYIKPAAEELGTGEEIEKMRELMRSDNGTEEKTVWRTGADRQSEVYGKAENLRNVVEECILKNGE